VCSICENPIIPRDGKDAFKIECMGRNFHENCYRCEVSGAEVKGCGHGQPCARISPAHCPQQRLRKMEIKT
jgi:hypothetical protein